jgi:hypothetical protein
MDMEILHVNSIHAVVKPEQTELLVEPVVELEVLILHPVLEKEERRQLI